MNDETLATLTHESFAGRLGESFVIAFDEAPDVELKLAEVNTVAGDSDDREPFSLIFLGPMAPLLPQAMFHLSHDELGTISLFLVPVGPDRDQTGMQYEAVFS